jgi:hypothetical protein
LIWQMERMCCSQTILALDKHELKNEIKC